MEDLPGIEKILGSKGVHVAVKNAMQVRNKYITSIMSQVCF